jgi:hypothetical protein
MVQQLTPATSDPPFCDAILPGRSDARPLGFQTRCLQERDDVGIKLCITIQDDVTIRAIFGKGLTQLLDHPLSGRVSSHVEVQNLPPSVFDDEKAVQELKRHRRHGKEVECSDHLAMIGKEGQPTLARVVTVANTLQVPSYTSFGDDEAQLLEFSVNLGRAPGRVLFRQAADERTDFRSSFRSAAARS